MPTVYCSACSKQISDQAISCPDCGQPNSARIGNGGRKSRVTAGVLALFLGGIGVHKFYLGKVGQGFLYLIFVWTFIPAIVALIEGIIYLVQDDVTFAQKQGVLV
jgi:TM2 domain-containing membrane protein YozV